VNPLPFPLVAVTDRHLAQPTLEIQVARIVAAGGRWVWFRDKDLERGERLELGLRLRDIVSAAGGRLSVGGDIDLALEMETGAAHVSTPADVAAARRRLGDGALVGMSAHAAGEAAQAQDAGADYVTLSPIHASPSKPGYGPALGPGAIAAAAKCGLPVLALGGVSPAHFAGLHASGAAGAAMMGSLMSASEPGPCIRAALAEWRPG
jgi:thiamine-phosphate pyrophosphorylase